MPVPQGYFVGGRDVFNRYRPTQLHPYFVKTQNNLRKDSSKRATQENLGDPFFYYKPRDPSDINLLATASFRFAPPTWSNFRNTVSRPLPAATESDLRLSSVNKAKEKKPLMLTLNVYPMENEFTESDRYTMPKFNFTSAPYIKPQDIESDPVAKLKKMKPNKMVIHLNLFSEPLESFQPRRKKIEFQKD